MHALGMLLVRVLHELLLLVEHGGAEELRTGAALVQRTMPKVGNAPKRTRRVLKQQSCTNKRMGQNGNRETRVRYPTRNAEQWNGVCYSKLDTEEWKRAASNSNKGQ